MRRNLLFNLVVLCLIAGMGNRLAGQEKSLAPSNQLHKGDKEQSKPESTNPGGVIVFDIETVQNDYPALPDNLKSSAFTEQKRLSVFRSEGASEKITNFESILPFPDNRSLQNGNPNELKSTLAGGTISPQPDNVDEDPVLKSAMAGPNLTPYQPSGWDSKIVISSATGTHTSTSPLWSNQTLYVDWAVVNNGTTAITTTFFSRIYVDGVLSGTWNTASLAAGYWAFVEDHNIGMLSVGSHTIRIDTDATGVITETNEADNSYTRTITVYPYVNLTTYQPVGWDNKIVLSKVAGTNTSDSQIFDTDNIYLDWAIRNISSYSTSTTFYVDLYIDGTWKAAWTRAGLAAGTTSTQLDYSVGKLSAGTHTFLLKIDMDGYIPEYNEADNEYSRTITVVNKNVLPYQRSGWDNKLVVSTVTGTNTSAPAIYNNQDIYVDWSVWNNGTAAVTETFHSKLYVDGVQKGYWHTAGLAANYTALVEDHNIGKLATGSHTVQIVTDCDGEVAESNEADNSYTRTFYVGPSYNLTPFQPGGWDNKLVLSTVTGTNTSATVFYDTQTIYVDWGCLNNANDDIAGTFYVRLYVDDVSKGAWTKTGLAHNTYTWGTDAAVGPLSAGTHTFKLVVDADGHVAESDETDNIYTRTITVVNKNLLPYQPAGWDNKIILSTVSGTNTSATTICENQPIYLDYAIRNNGSAAITETFYVRLYIDGVIKTTWSRVGLVANSYYTILDYSLGTLPAGTHTARIVVDVLDHVDETSEADNEYSRTFTVSSCKNLTPYQPATWDDKIVLSKVTGTHTSSSPIYDNQNVYLDWSVISNGSNDITETFTIKLYVDAVLRNSWPKTGLGAGISMNHNDYSVGLLTAGNHTFKIVVDADNTVNETNEGDNDYSRTISVQPSVPPAPVATAASAISQTGFNANWTAATGASGYYLDVSTSNTFGSFVTGYNNKNVGNVLTSAVTGLTAGTTYYYRLRAYNTSGTSPNSNVISVVTIPPAPVATAATLVTQTGFNTNWTAATGASVYYLDVSTSNTFGSFVTGYNNKNVGNVLTSAVTGLTAGTTYYYRLRAYNTSGTSPNSNVIQVKTNTPVNHFVAVGNPTDAMNISLLEAKFTGVNLEAGDEIGIFDGEVCVGAFKLSQSLGELNDGIVGYATAYGAEPGTTNGFISGHPISYRFWDQSEELEIANVAASCYNNLLDPVNCPVFEIGGSAFVRLIGASSVTQTIPFKTGWGIFSSFVIPPPANADMKNLFLPRITDGSLIKIQDENGNAVEDMGIFGGWTNNVGDISPSEGYKVKMRNACSLQIAGSAAAIPFNISLNTGWNIMGYPRTAEADALAVVQQLIDRRKLVKVQDENGNSIEDMGVFGGWVNNIGNFVPGKGYKIKLVSSDVLTVAAVYPAPKSAGIPQNKTLHTSHFRPVGEGNGTDHMNVIIVGLPAGLFRPGDEIGVFDRGLCVGAARIPDQATYLNIPVRAKDTDGEPGFTEGNPFSLRIWKAEMGAEYSVEPELIKGTSTFLKHESTFVSLAGNAANGLIIIPHDQGLSVKCFPNPFLDKVTIELRLAETSEVMVILFDQQGREIRRILPQTGLLSGIYYFNWDGRNNAGQDISHGIYHLRITAGNQVKLVKIVRVK